MQKVKQISIVVDWKIVLLLSALLLLFHNTSFSKTTTDTLLSKQLLTEMIRIHSESGEEQQLAEYLIQKSNEMGFHTHIFNNKDSSYNFSASLYPLSLNKPNLVFINHLDVVKAGDTILWKHPPYSAADINDTIWGRGALDMKGIAAMQLMATYRFLHEAKSRDLPYNVTVLFLSGEESGGIYGAKIIAENHLEQLNAVSIFGEGGTGLRNVLPSNPNKLLFFISTAEKKSLWVKLDLKMDSQGHGAIPSQKNVNRIMFKAISRFEHRKADIYFSPDAKVAFKKLGEINGGFQGFVLKHINWIPFRPFRKSILTKNPMLLSMVTNTMQLTSIQNPSCLPNQIACQVAAYYDCRLLPETNSQKYLKSTFFEILNPKIEIKIIDESPSAPASKRNNYYDLMEKALKTNYPQAEVIPILFPATTDNNYFRKQGIPTFGIMPLELDEELLNTIHGVNERIPFLNYLKGIDTYSLFIELLMKGGLN